MVTQAKLQRLYDEIALDQEQRDELASVLEHKKDAVRQKEEQGENQTLNSEEERESVWCVQRCAAVSASGS